MLEKMYRHEGHRIVFNRTSVNKCTVSAKPTMAQLKDRLRHVGFIRVPVLSCERFSLFALRRWVRLGRLQRQYYWPTRSVWQSYKWRYFWTNHFIFISDEVCVLSGRAITWCCMSAMHVRGSSAFWDGVVKKLWIIGSERSWTAI